VRSLRIPHNCSGACLGDSHHCAKLFEAEIDIEGLTKRPEIEMPVAPPLEGTYQPHPLFLKVDLCHGAIEKYFLQLQVHTESEYETKNKVIGLQFCRPLKGVPANMVSWNNKTMLATLQVKLRVRRIQQNTEDWLFRDDAGSGTRGKAHTLSQFRFSAQLGTAANEAERVTQEKELEEQPDIDRSPDLDGVCHAHARVWSKGNCPTRVK
jgi:hypothetical protein